MLEIHRSGDTPGHLEKPPLMNDIRDRVPIVPASLFGIVLGLIGLGNSWRTAHELWGLPAAIGESLMLVGGVVWTVLLLLFVTKWLFATEEALAEACHPVQCCFIGLAGVATMLVAVAAQPHARPIAVVIFALGFSFTFVFALWRSGSLWQGSRSAESTTPILYLPTVAGSYVTAIACGALGFVEWGRLAFGAGMISWLAIESIVIQRLLTSPEMPPALRPTLGIQLAPPTVGAAAYLSVTAGPPDFVAYALIGYGLFQFIVLARLSHWIFAGGVTASAWSFTFGLTALATALMKLVDRGGAGPFAVLAPAVFSLVCAVLGVLVLHTIGLLFSGRIVSQSPAKAPVTGPE